MTGRTRARRNTLCSFCGKRPDQVQRLIAGPGVYVCDQCISICNEILAEEPRPPQPFKATRCSTGRVRRPGGGGDASLAGGRATRS
jgi:hypothetical protein